MAFLVRRDEVIALRDALVALYAHAEDRSLVSLWERLRPLLEDARRTRRWRAPRATLDKMCRDALALCAHHPEARAKIEEAITRLPPGGEVIVPARRWLDLEIRFGPMRFIPESWSTFFVDALDSLFLAPDEDPTRPLEDLSYVASAVREGDDVRYVIDGESVVDWPSSFSEKVRIHAHVDELLEAIVGPFEPSRGPGPFLPMSTAARPLVETMLPVFTRATEAHFLADAPSLLAALDEVRAARAPVKPWDGDDELYEWSPTEPPWNVPWSTLVRRWEPFRDRFVDLLKEAIETENAVLFLEAEVGDLGPGGSVPVDETWGSPTS